MYSRNSFGSYYPVDSIVHRLNPIIKLINYIIIITLSILSNSIYINYFIFMIVFLLMMISYVPFKYYLNNIWSLRYIYLIIAFVCAYFNCDIQTYLIYIMKIISITEYLHVFTYTTSPSESTYGIEKFLSFFNIFGFPISSLSFKLNSLIRYIPSKLSIKNKIIKVVSSRGMDYYYKNIFSKFFMRFKLYFKRIRLNKIKNNKLKDVYSQKLFSFKRYRTNYRSTSIGFYDIFFFLLHIILILAYLKDRGILL